MGITMVELFQDGEQPYRSLPQMQNVLLFLEKGQRVAKEDLHGCSDNMYTVGVRPALHELLSCRFAF